MGVETGRSGGRLPRQEGRLWWGLLALVVLTHLVWLLIDTTPPFWDMAHHRIMGWQTLRAWRQARLLLELPRISDYYPPLYYLEEALVLRLFGSGRLVPLLANLPGILLLAYSTRRLGEHFLRPPAAQVAGILPLLFPLVAWTSRLSLLELSLAGWVAAAALLVVRSRHLESRPWSWLLGLVLAAGLLTKWTFLLFLAPLLLYALLRSGSRHQSFIHLLDALLIAAPLTCWWYLPNLASLVRRFQLTSQAARWEGDPSALSLAGWLYYPRCLSSYYLFLPLTLVLLGGAFLSWRRGVRAGQVPGIILWWLGGGWILLTLLGAKDPRYVLPLAAPLALLLAALLEGKGRWLQLVLVIAFVQFLTVSFPTPVSPFKLALFEIPGDRDYRSLSREWVLFETHYFDVAGPPRRGEWPYRELAALIPDGSRVGFVPDSPVANPVTLELFALRAGKTLDLVRLGAEEPRPRILVSCGYVVGKEGAQGLSYITSFNATVYQMLEDLAWPLERKWRLPDGTEMLLWRNPTLSR